MSTRRPSQPTPASRAASAIQTKERGVIAALVNHCEEKPPPMLARLLEHSPDSFDDLRYATIARVIFRLRCDGRDMNVVTIRRELLIADEPELGSLAVQLLNEDLPLALAEYDAADLWPAYQARRAKTLLCEAAAAATTNPGSVPDLLRRLPVEFAALADGMAANTTPAALPLSALVRHAGDDPDELLRHRFLCRGGGLLLCGPTGVGKSSLSIQCAVLWGIGKPSFGIYPARPLKSLVVQAENDGGDMAEFRDGVYHGLNLAEDERELAGNCVAVVREDERTGPDFFRSVVRPLLKEHRPDLLWIDPALSYLGGDVKSQEDVGGFLRNGLNPLLREFGCAAVVCHHTNKPPNGREKPDWQAGDFAYLGSGSAEWANWARAVLALRSLGSHEVFELRAGKRGSRLGWREEDGETHAFARNIAHGKDGIIYWRDAEVEEVPTPEAKAAPKTSADLLPHVPLAGAIRKATLADKAHGASIGEKKFRVLLAELLEDGTLHTWRQARPGTNAEVLISRHPQPAQSRL